MTQSAAAQADFSLVHFTDTHIMANGPYTPSTGGWQVDTTASLQRVITVLNALEPKPAFAIIGGDLTSPDLLQRDRVLTPEEYEPSYHLLQDLLGTLHCPAHMLLGNHDHRIAFHRVMQTAATSPEAPHYYSFDHQGYHFVALDSHQPGEAWGYLDTTQLDWLRADLDTHHNQPTFVFVHHPPCAIGIRWMDSSNALRAWNGPLGSFICTAIALQIYRLLRGGSRRSSFIAKSSRSRIAST
jgi:3',5'-cyclic AMP phosphodiesterase CpdA